MKRYGVEWLKMRNVLMLTFLYKTPGLDFIANFIELTINILYGLNRTLVSSYTAIVRMYFTGEYVLSSVVCHSQESSGIRTLEPWNVLPGQELTIGAKHVPMCS